MNHYSLIFRVAKPPNRIQGYYNRLFDLWLCRDVMARTFKIKARNVHVEITPWKSAMLAGETWHEILLSKPYTCFYINGNPSWDRILIGLDPAVYCFLKHNVGKRLWVRFTPISNRKPKTK